MSTNSITDRLPLGAGAAAGLGAYLLGYLITYVWQSGSIEDRLAGFNLAATLLGGEPIPPWQAVGWLFYNAHFVDTRAEVMGMQSANFIAESDGGALALLFLVPVVLLLGAGVLLARAADADEPASGAAAGASVAIGYFPPALAGAFLFSYDGVIAPTLVTALLLAGLVYPLALGAVGGAAWSAVGGD